MFKGLRGIIFVGLISILTTLTTFGVAQGISPNNTTVEEATIKIVQEYAAELLPASSFASLVADLVGGGRHAHGHIDDPLAESLLQQKDEPISRAMLIELLCLIRNHDPSCGETDLLVEGLDPSDVDTFIDSDRTQTDTGTPPTSPEN